MPSNLSASYWTSHKKLKKPEITRSWLKERKPLGPKATLAQTRRQYAEEEEWRTQYTSDNRNDHPGLGCGGGTIIVKNGIPFKSPYSSEMKLEVQGGIRFIGPKFWSGSSQIHGETYGHSLVIMYPFQITEQIFVRPAKEPEATSSAQANHLVTIIPTKCVGTSSLKRVLPTIIEFELPHGKHDDGYGDSFSWRKQSDQTYLEKFTDACNTLLDKEGKRIINLCDGLTDQMACKANWFRERTTTLGKEGKDPGTLYFVSEGIFFASDAQNEDGSPRHIYFSIDTKSPSDRSRILDQIMFIAEKDCARNKEIAGLSLWLACVKESPIWSETESAPSTDHASSSQTAGELLQFTDLDPSLWDELSSWVTSHYTAVDSSTHAKSSQEGQESKDPNEATKPRRSQCLKRKHDEIDDKENNDPRPAETTKSAKPKQTAGTKETATKPGSSKSAVEVRLVQDLWLDYDKRIPLSGLHAYRP